MIAVFQVNFHLAVKESVLLTAKTSAVVCRLFVGSATFCHKGVASKRVTLNQNFAGMLPFLAIQVIAPVLLYVFPGIGPWLPHTLYK